MDSFDDKEFKLENYLNKCRCCFKVLKDQEFSDITKETEKKFYELTQVHVKLKVL